MYIDPPNAGVIVGVIALIVIGLATAGITIWNRGWLKGYADGQQEAEEERDYEIGQALQPTPPERLGRKTLPVTPIPIRLTLKRVRMDQRGASHPAAAVIARWAQRYLKRTRSTLTSPMTISYTEDHGDYFIRNLALLWVDANHVLGGQDHGLPAYMMTKAEAVEILARKYAHG